MTKPFSLIFNESYSGCGYIRLMYATNFLNSIVADKGKLQFIHSQYFINDIEFLKMTRSIVFQKLGDEYHRRAFDFYKKYSKQLGYKMVFEIDDYVFDIPHYNVARLAFRPQLENLKHMMSNADILVVSTERLKQKLSEYNENIFVVKNAIPKYLYGEKNNYQHKYKTKDIKTAKVVYGGSATHFSNDKKMLGDISHVWVNYLLSAINKNEIELHIFGDKTPFFLSAVSDKIVSHSWQGSYEYPQYFSNQNFDFSISPLQPNVFNECKSDIKTIEAYATGILPVGSVWSNGKSPYESNFLKINEDTCTENDIREIIETNKNRDRYNKMLDNGFKWLYKKHRYLEDETYLKNFVRAV